MDYKSTLRMPQTDFEMRGNLPKKEPLFQERWEKEDLYHEMLSKHDGYPTFILHDGPPYANGDIHIGHGLNKILKDVIVRSKYKAGYQTPFIPGWDTHGLPIETAITKLGYDRKKMPINEFRKLCYDYALKQVANQMATMKKLGTVADYDHPYITLQKEYEGHQIEIFAKMAMDGLIYKGLKPVYWSPSSESALAEAEIEYKDVKSPTIYVKFQVKDGKGILDENDYFVIWTTTPWTIPANLAICLNERLEYALVKSEKGNLLVLKELVDSLWEKFGLKEKEILKTFKGKELEGITTRHPLYDRESIIILGDHVTADAGTGCVHTAPGHGVEDFMVGLKYGLEAYCPVDEHGCMTEDCGDWLKGQYVDDANKTVTLKLDEVGALLKLEFITHSYPHDWRTKKPIIFRATTQWFASVDKIREKLLGEIEKIDWKPAWGEQRMYNMIKDRSDWCISRQRAWGVPIPIFYAEDGTPIMDEKVFKHVASLVKEYGSNVWFEREAKDLLPEGYTHPGSPNNIFKKETDTMDVWFDSGSSHTGCMVERGYSLPVDLYFEGSDQYRGWFNSSLIVSTAFYGYAPYKQVLSHGFVMDGKGVKMSKSQFNAVSPANIMKQYGADVLRLWASSVDYQADCVMSDELLKQCSEAYRKVRNTFRFMLANINPNDFTKEDLLDPNECSVVDKDILLKLNEVSDKVKKAYADYDFMSVTSTLSTFMSNELSSYYLDFAKDILYIEAHDDVRRRQVQSVIYYCVDTLMRLWAPILVHTCEEINDHFDKGESVHLKEFNENYEINDAQAIREKMARLMELRSDVFKALEEARAEKKIGKSLEATVYMHVSDADQKIIDEVLGCKLAQWLIVSEAILTDTPLKKYESCEVSVEKCQGKVCPRCWNMHDDSDAHECCNRCVEVLKKEYPQVPIL